MTIESVIAYSGKPTPTGGTVGEIFGTEHFGMFLYAYMRMSRPTTVVELGVGAATTTAFMAQALKDNNYGKLWCVDDGSAWNSAQFRSRIQQSLGYEDPAESYTEFVLRVLRTHDLASSTQFVGKTLAAGDYFAPEGEIDLLFSDATSSDAEGCIDLLRYYLPRMSAFSSIFIDKASTVNHSYLLLEYFVNEARAGRLPAHLVSGLSQAEQRRMWSLVRTSRISLVHLTDSDPNKRNPAQNSRAWLRIEPLDVMPHNGVKSYF